MPKSSTHLSLQGWTKKLERIKYPAPLLENPVTPQVEEMLVPVPYHPRRRARGPRMGPAAKAL